MSCNYADGLSPYHDKGQLGLEERFDSKSVATAKVALLTKWINEANHVVIHTGAGISTSAGIPDFRGPKGVWTLEAKGEKPDLSTDFNDAIPTITHMAITKLVERGKVKYVVSQNIDGLHLRSNLQRKYLSELHGNMFTEQCNACGRQFVRSSAVPTVGQKSLNKPCPTLKVNGRPCRGRLHDTILDWEHNLPENDLGMADYHSCLADLSICLGTTMQIVPSGNLPLYTKKHGGKLVICNLQPTKHNRKADLIIHAYVDEVMTMLMKNLNLKIPKYSPKSDPTKLVAQSPEKFLEWTISDYALKKMKKIYEEKCGTKEAKKRLEMIDDDLPLSVAKNLKRSRVKDDDDSDLEVLDVIVKPKRGGREASKRGQKKNTSGYSQTITVKKVTPPPKKGKYETEKITIKKNVTPTKTKYEIVQPKPKKTPKCEIVYSTEDSDACNDLDMICESDDDEMTNNFTTNFRLYLYDEKDVKKEEAEEKKAETEETTCVKNETKSEETVESEAKEPSKAEEFVKEEDKGVEASEKQAEISLEDAVKEEIKEAEKDEKVEEPSPVVEKPLTNEAVGAETAETGGGSTKTPEEELADYIKSAEMEAEKNSRLEGGESDANGKLNHELDVAIKEAEEKAKDIRSKVESEIDELVNNHRSAQFETIPELSMNQSVNENYGFYNNQYNATSNSTDLEYVDNNYYNSFQ